MSGDAIRTTLKTFIVVTLTFSLLTLVVPPDWIPKGYRPYYYAIFGERNFQKAPPSESTPEYNPSTLCRNNHPEWKKAGTIDGVSIAESPVCSPDNPYVVAAAVKGTNKVNKRVLMKSGLNPRAIVKENDRDKDGDPDEIHIRLEVHELNGASPDTTTPVPNYEIAPGIEPGFWVFTPKLRGMSTRGIDDPKANPLIRPPSPSIRVEEGDRVSVTLENTHYLPHTIHLHGVDHGFLQEDGTGNDGVPQTSEKPLKPGQSRTYKISPRIPGTMFYHCHVQPQAHVLMGLQGLFVIEEERNNNSVQTFNVGAGLVRHSSNSVDRNYHREFDLQYQDIDRELHEIIQEHNDPRKITWSINRFYKNHERSPDYYILNGRSFPFTFRESIIAVKPNRKYKLRILNGGLQGISLHTHGHKFTITHKDGVYVDKDQQIKRDVAWISAAQRLDLRINTTDDGLHSYGDGIWFLHDHRESGITTAGMAPGGNISAIVYESYLKKNGWPRTRGSRLGKLFTSRYYEGELPVWDFSQIFRQPLPTTVSGYTQLITGLIIGLLTGLLFLGVRES